MRRRKFFAGSLLGLLGISMTKDSGATVENAMLYDSEGRQKQSRISFEIGHVKMSNGEMMKTYAMFNHGFSYVGIDDGCWVIINAFDGKADLASHISPEAHVALSHLPHNPRLYLEELG